MKTAFKTQFQLKLQSNTLMYFAGNTSLTSELKTISQLILERLEYDIPVNCN